MLSMTSPSGQNRKIHSYFFGDFAHWNSPYQLKVARVGNMLCWAETELFVTVSLQV